MIVRIAIHQLGLQIFDHVGKVVRSGTRIRQRQLSTLNKGFDSIFDVSGPEGRVESEARFSHLLRNLRHFLLFLLRASHCVKEI